MVNVKRRKRSLNADYDFGKWSTSYDIRSVKGPWQKQEDDMLESIVQQYGAKDWSTVSIQMAKRGSHRQGKQCRERWYNHLSPEVRKVAWTKEEDEIIITYHKKWGNSWTAISKLLQGRPANAIKNHWNSTLRKGLEQSSMPKNKKIKFYNEEMESRNDIKCENNCGNLINEKEVSVEGISDITNSSSDQDNIDEFQNSSLQFDSKSLNGSYDMDFSIRSSLEPEHIEEYEGIPLIGINDYYMSHPYLHDQIRYTSSWEVVIDSNTWPDLAFNHPYLEYD